ncbi:hypothetical protein EfmJHP35_10650 [Enterococcus faecium]|nr:hypothetical protein EfmJHP35_10650 [Enterococcus faecium]
MIKILVLQIDALTHYGIDKLFQEKVTGAKKDRPQLEEMINLLREGDSVVIYKLDRISRSTKHLIELSELFEELSVNFISIQDNVDTSTSMGRFFFRVMASLAELERDIIIEQLTLVLRQPESEEKKRGRPSKGKLSIDLALKMYDSKEYSIRQPLN